MNSYITNSFIECFKKLPDRIRKLAKKNYILWRNNPNYPGVDFKKIESKDDVYSIRIGIGYRALGIKEDNDIIWFLIGTHSEYNKLL